MLIVLRCSAVMWRQDIQWRHLHTRGRWMLWGVWIKYRRDMKYIYAEELQKVSGKREFSAVGLEILSKQRTSMSQGMEVYQSLTYFDQWERNVMWFESRFYGREWPRMSPKVGGWWQTLKVFPPHVEKSLDFAFEPDGG